MTESLQPLLMGVFDYAGLFPPAALSLEEAAANYERYRKSPDSWMLGHFVILAARLAELPPLLDKLLPPGEAWSYSVLGRGDENPASWLNGLSEDATAASKFLKSEQARAAIPVFELRLPSGVGEMDTPALEDLCASAAARMTGAVPREPLVLFEIPRGANWLDTLPRVAAVLAGINQKDARRCGLKLRAGGPTADDIPSVAEVADLIAVCRAERLPWKATAGLHRPLRGFCPEVQAGMHGFLNLLVASVLAEALNISREMITRILSDEVTANFEFGHYFLSWRGTSANLVQIRAARERGMQSVGSCSFEEPCEHLRELARL